MNEENEKRLFETFRFFNPNDKSNSLMRFGFTHGDGWYDIIYRLCQGIQDHLDEIDRTNAVPPSSPFEVLQVKEKFGGLRFYTNWEDDVIRDLINRAESASLETCELCGLQGEQRGGGWIRTLCDACDKKK